MHGHFVYICCLALVLGLTHIKNHDFRIIVSTGIKKKKKLTAVQEHCFLPPPALLPCPAMTLSDFDSAKAVL